MEYILLVTWFAAGQSPAHYQVVFQSNGACFQAMSDLRHEETRLMEVFARTYERKVGGSSVTVGPSVPPALTVACVPRK